MSKQQQKAKSFMEELDAWSEANVIEPLIDCEQEVNRRETLEDTIARVKKAIRQKVLESYRNGQTAGPTAPRSSSGSKPRRQPARAES
jgi:hypothetical protein